MSGEELSPPTSPMHVSPPTSPAVVQSSPVRDGDTALSHSESTGGSFSSDSSLVQGKRKRRVCRTTLQRRLRRQEQLDEANSSSGNEEEAFDVNEVVGRQNYPPEYAAHRQDDEAVITCNQSHDRHDSSEDSSERESGGSFSESDSVGSHCSSRVLSSEVRSNDGEIASDESDSSESVNDSDLYEGSEITANEALLKVLKLYVEERMTKTSLNKNIKLIKSLLPQPNEMPSSAKAALKKLEDLTSACTEGEHVFCHKCLQLVEKDNDDSADVSSDDADSDDNQCLHDAGRGKFYSFPIEQQLKHMFEQRGLAAAIESFQEQRRTPDYVCDIFDGVEYKKVKVKLPNIYDLILLWNTDGVALSSSSNQELWIILCIICGLPPHLRSSYVLVAGVYVHEKAPDMNVFLKPFVDSLKNLFENGFQWIHPVTKEAIVSKIAAPLFSADAPAKSHVLNCKNHNYKFGCLICEQKTRRIELPARNENENPKHLRRFLYEDDVAPAQLRTGQRMDLLGSLAKRRQKARKGVIGDSVVSEIPLSDRATCICAEYMHLVLLGVVKYFLLIIFTKPGVWSLGAKVQEINEFIMNYIKVPDFISRLPRKIKDLKYWKASELRAFLLFYSLPIFKKFGFPDDYLQHWLLLVSAIHILLKEAISVDDLNSAEVMLRGFVRDVGKLYGEKYYTYNVHNLLHVCLLVRRWGPLWATSAFPFETFNGFLGANVHGTKNLGVELIKNIKISQSVVMLENIVSAPRCPAQRNVSQVFGKEKSSWKILDDEQRGAVDSAAHLLGNYVLHIRAKFRSMIFTSRLYDTNKKRANSYIQLNSDDGRYKFAEIIVFIKAEDTTLYCLVEALKVLQVDLIFHQESHYVIRNILPIEKSGTLLVIPMHCIQTKVLMVGNYICLRPNSYEVNL